eukprot:TRINITY_DN6162_c0_g1_i12.p1 TRINITY_DN6162_c0_g1~~TRINITY_DN6162_c0_g1_i12.p1  ORF type:complete len:538 (-),score=180.00 TRINITY_DN6162_c0_g1_i12:241-1767(-)
MCIRDRSTWDQCVKAIGKGSFAKVYLITRIIDKNEMAVKSFEKKQLMQSMKNKLSLINEINIMRRMHHENIIKLYEVYESDNHVNLILELLKGGELFDRIVKKGHYTESDACALMRRLLSALDYMHQRGIMHRDIKPENLILKSNEDDTDIKIADFGLAAFVSSGEQLFKRCGTPGYVAPEILDDQPYDQKVDVFSAGVILYILLTGCSPFYGKTYNEILIKNKKCEIKFNFDEQKIKPSDLAIDLLKSMLEKNPEYRITAYEALSHPWINGGGITSPGGIPKYLNSAQENMRRFQEENRFNVSKIKPKDLGIQTRSPVINGRTLTIEDPNSSSLLNSPSIKAAGARREVDMRKMAILQNASRRAGGDSVDHDESEVNDDGGFSTPSMMYRTPKATTSTGRDGSTQASPKTAPSSTNKRDVGGEKIMSSFGQNQKNADDAKKDVPQGLAKEVRNFLKKLEQRCDEFEESLWTRIACVRESQPFAFMNFLSSTFFQLFHALQFFFAPLC